MDQRGVLRSDPLAAGEVLTEQVLVDDCEAVRAGAGHRADELERLRLPAAAAIFDELGDAASAGRCRALAARRGRLTGWRETLPLVGRLADHDRYDDLYLPDPGARAELHRTEDDRSCPGPPC